VNATDGFSSGQGFRLDNERGEPDNERVEPCPRPRFLNKYVATSTKKKKHESNKSQKNKGHVKIFTAEDVQKTGRSFPWSIFAPGLLARTPALFTPVVIEPHTGGLSAGG